MNHIEITSLKTNVPILVIFCSLYASNGLAAELPDHINQQVSKQNQLLDLNLDDLLNIQVTSVSKKPQKVSKSAAAIFVITNQDIKKSGVTSIPEALRMAPGIDVARIDNNEWAISARGFNGRFANKLLVLIDGRTVYTPFFSGVNWDVQDTLLEDIDRIEVIRGPGASLWGANAVNGVINIISKTAAQTQGGYVMAGGGSMEKVFGGFRYGGQLNESIHYRLYSKYFERESDENWRMGQGGARVDWDVSKVDKFTVQGDIYQGKTGDVVNEPSITPPYNTLVRNQSKLVGGNILFRWNKQLKPDEAIALQIYYDYTEKDAYEIRQEHSTFDIDFQHTLSLNANNNLTWGAGYRFINADAKSTFLVTPTPIQTDTHLFNLFVQNDWELIDDELTLTLGSKIEHNDYSGFEIQPNARMIWTPTSDQSVWLSISRAVRTSSRAEQGGVINQQTIPPSPASLNRPVLVTLTGSIDDASEKVMAYELGYRIKPVDELSLDIAAFYNIYDNLRNFQPGTAQFAGTHFVQPLFLHTDMSGESYGAEFALSWKALDNLKIDATYSYIQMQLHAENGDSNLSENAEKQTPHHKASIRSSLNILSSLDWDIWLRYVDNVPDFQIPSYVTLDTRLAWQPIKSLNLSITGQNLLDNQHPEFGKDFILSRPSEIERGVYGKVEWRF